jgi:hypothetical protein
MEHDREEDVREESPVEDSDTSDSGGDEGARVVENTEANVNELVRVRERTRAPCPS